MSRTYNDPNALAGANGAGEGIAERQCAPNNTRTGTAPDRPHMRLVWSKQAPPPAKLTAQDRRFLRSLTRHPLPLVASQRALLQHVAGAL